MKKNRKWLYSLFAVLIATTILSGCSGSDASYSGDGPLYKNPEAGVQERVNDLLARMTLEEKIGQMTQAAMNVVKHTDITSMYLGSVLSGGGGCPKPNTPEAWADMIDGFQNQALATRLGIPLLYGVDAVHGHNNVKGAVIFPHNIGLGAAGDGDLVERIGRITAVEMTATGALWNFAPVVAVPQDIRWGRTYEAYSENTELVSRLARAYIRGLQNTDSSGLGAAADGSGRGARASEVVRGVREERWRCGARSELPGVARARGAFARRREAEEGTGRRLPHRLRRRLRQPPRRRGGRPRGGGGVRSREGARREFASAVHRHPHQAADRGAPRAQHPHARRFRLDARGGHGREAAA